MLRRVLTRRSAHSAAARLSAGASARRHVSTATPNSAAIAAAFAVAQHKHAYQQAAQQSDRVAPAALKSLHSSAAQHIAAAAIKPAAAAAATAAARAVPAAAAVPAASPEELLLQQQALLLANGRLKLEFAGADKMGTSLAEDVRIGFAKTPKSLPPKWFYDERGSVLFDRICDTPEYYPTRTEYKLLQSISSQVIAITQPTDIVELGSGAARKTRLLFDAVARESVSRGGDGATPHVRFVPYDVSGEMLSASSVDLCREYPWLRVHGLVATFDHLHPFPAPAVDPNTQLPGNRLTAFIGSTIGNFEPGADVAFLRRVRQQMRTPAAAKGQAQGLLQGQGQGQGQDWFLLGLDLVKPHAVLNAAYNDVQGLTADFNLNVLNVINRELDADFDTRKFQHVAFFNPALSRIEMHLWCCQSHTVTIKKQNTKLRFTAGETIHTEISRKFTRQTTEQLLRASGFQPTHWFQSDDAYFGMCLAQPAPLDAAGAGTAAVSSA